MIRNPELKEKPLGVQQKSLVVTCNYEARKLGVKKLMAVRDALEKCPQLVLVNGEDLTPYREMSYKVTELLGEFCPLVERLGFDENFVDITEMVEKKLKQLQQRECSGVSVSGHVYNNQALNLEDKTHLSLIIGSQLAEEFREAIYAKLGLTGCAGVASNKLLAKLVSGTHKPNQQTVLLPESSPDLLGGLENIQKLPGIGSKTSKRLEMLGVKKVGDLQTLPSDVLEKEFGVSHAQRLQKLSWGEDEAPVVPAGPPQSFSDEDSFRRCSSEVEVKEKIQELLPSLLDRIHRDGRQPHTVRLSIRHVSSAERWWHRESRQCPVPPHLLQRLGKDSSVIPPLTDTLMKLFRKMIDGTQPFHLTLLSICFSNLKALPSSKKGSIGFYLKPRIKSSPPPSRCGKRGWEGDDDDEEDPQGNSSWNQHCKRSGPAKTQSLSEGKQSNLKEAGMVAFPLHLWPAVDQEVFRELPEDIQKELVSGETEMSLPEEVSGEPAVGFPPETHSTSPNSEGVKRSSTRSNPHLTSAPQAAALLPHNSRASSSTECPRSTGPSKGVEKPPPDSQSFRENEVASLEAGLSQTGLPFPVKQGFDPTSEEKPWSREVVELPPHVDTRTFHELPLEVQEELLAEWKNQESPVPQEKAPGKPKGKKGRRNTPPPWSPQANNLLRYFKPQ